MLMQHVQKIGGTRIARSADRETVKGGPRTQCVRGGWWRATGPVQVPTGKHPPLYLVRSDRREAKTDAGHEGTWLCGCGTAAWERRARARRGEAQAPRGGAGVCSTQLGRLAWTHKRLKKLKILGFNPG